MNDSILGSWNLCADRRCHHFLRGKTLCGSTSEAKGPVPRRTAGYTRQPDVSNYCPTCLARQRARWSNSDGEPDAVDSAAEAK